MAGVEAPRLVVYVRADCSLCDGLLGDLDAWLAGRPLAVELRDVDADPASRARFGLKVPALTLDGRLVCYGRFDAARLEARLRAA